MGKLSQGKISDLSASALLAATNTKSSVGKARGKEEKMLERVKSTRSQLQSSFAPALSVPISACLKDGSVQKVQSLQ